MIPAIMKPFFISIPHSGERVPPEASWLQGLPEPILMCDVDRFVDRLYQPIVTELNVPCVTTPWHRYAVDLNRLKDDVDRDSVEDSGNASGTFTTGLHWVKTTRGNRLMPAPISRQTHDKLVRGYFVPFHAEVLGVYEDLAKHGAKRTFHIDAHSMPSVGTAAHRDPGQTRADAVISDQEGRSCSAEFRDLVIAAYESAGLKVAYNWPYVGGRVTQTYGRPAEDRHVIQVELSRALYMDENSKQILPEPALALTKQLSAAVRAIHAGLPDVKDPS